MDRQAVKGAEEFVPLTPIKKLSSECWDVNFSNLQSLLLFVLFVLLVVLQVKLYLFLLYFALFGYILNAELTIAVQ